MLLRILSNLFTRRGDAAASHAEALGRYAQGDLEGAERRLREAVRLAPHDVSGWINLAIVLRAQQKYGPAVPILLGVVERRPELAGAHADLAICYSRLRRNAEAIPHFKRAIELDPGLHLAHASLVDAYLDCCDWDAVDEWRRRFLDYRSRHPRELWAKRIEPFTALTLFPGEIARSVAEQRAFDLVQSVRRFAPRPARATTHARIRIGYVSADFYDHATAHLTRGLYEAHDRARFEVYAYSSGPDDGSDYRRHIERTCDRFVDVRNETPEATAGRIRDDAVDILVDMKGHTAHARPEIFAMRPAPLQVSYLGYPGTMGADFIDYFISDAVATPPGFETEFTEQVVRLPGSYQVNDAAQPVASFAPGRAEAGLPERGFVYCGFNRLGKIDRAIFAVWMDILSAVPGSVLWLTREDPSAERNLLAAACERGMGAGRLVFSDKVPKPQHLARHRLADLFLDTTAYNAHTGASDALWAGLPVLTCPGGTFARRVAASLLHAAGLPELAVRDLDAYREEAIRLAREPDRLAAIRARLEGNRLGCDLFNTAGHARHLEAAYLEMHRRRQRGEAPQAFSVTRRDTPA